MKTIPNMREINISQTEYVTKYNEYLKRLNDRKKLEILESKLIFDSHEFNGNTTRFINQSRNEIIDDYLSLTIPKILTIRHNLTKTHKFLQIYFKNKMNLIKSRNRRSILKNTTQSRAFYIRFPLKLSYLNETESKILNSSSDRIQESSLRIMVVTDPDQTNLRQTQENMSKTFNESHHRRHKTYHDYLLNYSKNLNNEYLNKNSDIYSNFKNILTLKVYQLLNDGNKIHLDSKEVLIIPKRKQFNWIEFDVTKAVLDWLNNSSQNNGLEILCNLCVKYGSYVVDDSSVDAQSNDLKKEKIPRDDCDLNENSADSINCIGIKEDLSPVLNIVAKIDNTRRGKRSRQHHHHDTHHHQLVSSIVGRKKRKTDCYEGNQRCCRHQMEVIFQNIKGFEFIIQPKRFDAGYCSGKCPPRYNPANHHAVLQSLIWKQDRNKAPRPCCAPSKLVELEVLHVDEKDSRKLKVSTWSDMKVVDCACS